MLNISKYIKVKELEVQLQKEEISKHFPTSISEYLLVSFVRIFCSFFLIVYFRLV